jgi:hypothetical protein
MRAIYCFDCFGGKSAKLCIKSLISHDIAARQWRGSIPLHISLVRSKSTKKCLRRAASAVVPATRGVWGQAKDGSNRRQYPERLHARRSPRRLAPLPPPLADEAATSATSATSQSFQMDNVAAHEIGSATSLFNPQQGSSPDVAAVAGDVAARCGSSRAKNPDGTSDVVPVADVAHSAGNGGGPSLSEWRVDGALQPPNPSRQRTRI